MKINVPKTGDFQKKTPILTLVDDTSTYSVNKANAVSFDLKVNPADAASSTYKQMFRILTGSETIRQILRWKSNVGTVFAGLNALDVAARRPIACTLMREGQKALFNTELSNLAGDHYNTAMVAARASDVALGDGLTTDADQVRLNGRNFYLTNGDVETALQRVITSLLPRQVLAKVKRALRRDMRKPSDMKVRAYYQHLLWINTEELVGLPPAFDQTQRLSEEEMIDIVLFGTPRSWQNEMDRQGFDPMTKTLAEVIDFMENIEATEERSENKPKSNDNKSKQKDTKKSKKGSSDNGNNNNTNKTKFYCTEHGENWSHDTKDCRTLQRKNGNGDKFTNKTWNRKSDEAKKEASKEFATLIGKEIRKGVKKQLASVDSRKL